MKIEDFKYQMSGYGWAIFPNVIPMDLVDRMRVDIEKCYVRCREIQLANGLDNTEYTVHHLVGQEQSFMDCLVEYQKLDSYFESYFCGKYILNSFGGNILTKGTSYANNIHRELRSFSGPIPLMLNTLLFLDDFTHENGATWLMNRGHIYPDKPTEEEFMKQAFQITGKAGSVAVWDSNLWHRAGINNTDQPRRSVTPELSRPFMKEGFCYSQFCDERSSPWIKQILGYNSRTPSNLSDWYQPPEKRFYKGSQG